MIEVYFTKNKGYEHCIDISIDENTITKVQRLYKNCKISKYKAYHRNELVYIYELNEDSQFVYSKIREDHKQIPIANVGVHCYSYKFSKLPTHLFSCTNNIDHIVEYSISEYKITNRLSVIIRSDDYGKYLYIQYKHSDNVEIEKVNSNINSIIDTISKNI